MRLQNYIIESEKEIRVENISKLCNLIKKNCNQYIKLLKGKKPLFRSIHTDAWYHAGIKNVRKDRFSRLMGLAMLGFMDKYLKSKNLPLRKESMICTPNESHIRMFGGQRCFVFPIGKFKYAMVRSSDMNFSNSNRTWAPDELSSRISDYYTYSGGEKTEEGREEKTDLYEYLDKSIDGNSQKAFNEAYKNSYEMWFDCKQYYYVHIDGNWSGIYNMF